MYIVYIGKSENVDGYLGRSESVDGYLGRSDNVDGYHGRWTGSRKAGFRNKEAHQAVGDNGKDRLQTKIILDREDLQKSTLQILG